MYSTNKFYLILSILSCILFNYVSALECINCNSKDDPNCIEHPLRTGKKEKCGELQTQCVIALLPNGHIYRGCAPLNWEFEQPSELCDKDHCNIYLYPADRLKCIKCSGEDCVAQQSNEKLSYCRIYKENDLCYTSITESENGVRGCLTDIGGIPLDNIETCKENGCNKENGIVNVECIQCDSTNDKDCVRSTDGKPIGGKVCKSNLLRGQKTPGCFIYHRLDLLIRDCYSNINKHKNLIKENTTVCQYNKCNKKSIPVQKCNVCGKGTEDIKCEVNNSESCKDQSSSCYSCFNDIKNLDLISRGCGSNPEKSNCYQCNGDNCNKKLPKLCYKCSSKTNENCAIINHSIVLEKELCETPDTECMTGVDKDGYTVRQCAPADYDLKNYQQAEKCSESLCNNKMFPLKQLFCFTCSGTDECSADPSVQLLKPCKQIKHDNKCYEFEKKDTKNIVRGCSTDSNYTECIKNKDCKTCLGSQCNNKLINLKKSELNCLHCNGKDDKNCGWTQKENDKSIKCTSFIPKKEKEFCYSIVNEDKTVARGCSWDDKICTDPTKNKLCKVCEKNKCNTELLTAQYCIQKEDGNEETIKSEKTACPDKEMYSQNQGCYVHRNGTKINFGCQSKMTPQFLAYCQYEHSKCNMCTGSECDDMKIPNKSSSIAIISSSLLIILAYFTYKI